jgi:hypothetical protein
MPTKQIEAIDQVKALLKSYSGRDQVKSIIATLDRLRLLTMSTEPNKAGLVEADKVANERRALLRAEMLTESRSALDQSYFDAIFAVQILLGTYWPINEREANGYPSDPLLQHDGFAPDLEVIAVSTGRLFEKASLVDYFARGMGIDNDSKEGARIVTPLMDVLTPRDIVYLENHGVRVPEVEAAEQVEVNHAVPAAPFIGVPLGPVIPPPVRGRKRNIFRFISAMLADFYNRNNPDAPHNFEAELEDAPMVGMTFGVFIGGMGGLMLVGGLFGACFGLLAVPGAIAVGALAAIAGFVKIINIVREEHDYPPKPNSLVRFFGSLTIAAVASMVAIALLSLVAPYVVAGLASYSVISAASAAVVVANLALIQIVVPAVLCLVGIVKECFRAGAMEDFYENCAVEIVAISAALMAVIFGSVGVLVDVFVARRAEAPQPAPVIAREERHPRDDADNHNPLIHANRANHLGFDPELLNGDNANLVHKAAPNHAGIYRGLRDARVDEGEEKQDNLEQENLEPLSPEMLAAIAVVDQEERGKDYVSDNDDEIDNEFKVPILGRR